MVACGTGSAEWDCIQFDSIMIIFFTLCVKMFLKLQEHGNNFLHDGDVLLLLSNQTHDGEDSMFIHHGHDG